MKISVLMNTCNRAYLLRYALLSYLRQSEQDFEIVVADDGSTDDTPEVVEAFRERAPFDVSYVRQEKQGHRRAATLNRGVLRCRHPWILFTDCDSLAFSDLVAVHRRHAEADRLLCGGYVRLDEATTAALSDEQVTSGEFESLLGPDGRRALARKHRRARLQILLRRRRRPHNMGLNYSVSRDALYRINGYDEHFQGWGSADGDVRERLRRTGVRPFSLYDRAIVLHMWHPREPSQTDRASLNRNRSWAARSDAPVFAERGLRSAGQAPAPGG